MKYIYFVSYNHIKGFGNTEIIINKKIDDFEMLEEVIKLLVEARIKRSNNN